MRATTQKEEGGGPPGEEGDRRGGSSPWGSSDRESLVDRALKGLGSLIAPGLADVLWGLQSKWALTG